MKIVRSLSLELESAFVYVRSQELTTIKFRMLGTPQVP
jgi:hypothetical protein